MNTVNYPYRLTYKRLNNGYLLYLNERSVEITKPQGMNGILKKREESETVPGFSYTGPREDGGTFIEIGEVTDKNRKDKFITGLIRTRYTADEVEAIILNGSNTERHAVELAALQSFRQECKDAVNELLSR